MHASWMPLAVLALALVMPTAAEAQYTLSRGRVQLSGSASWSRTTMTASTGEEQKVTNATLTPGVQYFIRDGLAIGGQVVAQYQSQGESRSETYGVGPFVSYYFGRAVQRIYPFVQGGLHYYRVEQRGPLVTIPRLSATGYQASAGLLVVFTRTAGVTSQLLYRSMDLRGGDAQFDASEFGVSVGISAFAF